MSITASMLYDYVQCPHRVWRDVWGPQEEKIQETNPFLELLWQRGIQHEEEVIQNIGQFVDLSEGTLNERYQATLQEMRKGTSLIYQGVLIYENLLGIPDLLELQPNSQYIPVDIKSGAGLEGINDEEGEEGKPKKHYALQLCLYVDALKKNEFATENTGVIIDIHRNEVIYELDKPQSKRNQQTWWELYQEVKEEVGLLRENQKHNKPALVGVCKLCPWYSSCKKWCKETNDLTNIFYLGRKVRDTLNSDLGIENLNQLLVLDVEYALAQKTKNKDFMKGIGESTLNSIRRRADILVNIKMPVVYNPIIFPKVSIELFFDIEDDPTQDFVYLHGIYERRNREGRCAYFLTEENTQDSERKAWKDFWDYIRALPPNDFAVYYYSHHEKTTYKKLRERYPDAISETDLDTYFSSTYFIDLYSCVSQNTDWPLSSYSIKEIATSLEFKWRDETPSGALSIQWYNQYLDTGDKSLLQRILEYNEDDCKATMVLKDGLESLSDEKFPKKD